jgi:pilus assembly protein Flp/PilA
MLFLPRNKGQSLLEYALLLALVAIVVVAVLTLLGFAVSNVFSRVAGGLSGGSSSGPGKDCYGSLLLPYLVGLTMLFLLVFRWTPNRSSVPTKA